MNTILDDLADGLSDSINVAGTKAFGAAQSMGGFNLTNLAAATANGHAVRYEQLTGLSATYQPLDATLTALAALSWASGSPLVQFAAADTVSLTLTPSVSSITASQGAAATTPSATFTNTTDAAAVKVATFSGDRATVAANDSAYNAHELSDSAGNQDEAFRLEWQFWDATSGSEDCQVNFHLRNAGTLQSRYQFFATAFRPSNDDGAALGGTSNKWSDLFLASGAVLNFNNGDVLLTHSSNALEVTGGGFAAPLLQVTGVGAETLAAATHRNRQLLLDGDITLDDGIFAAGDWHVFCCDGTNRTVTRAAGLTMRVNGTDSASATIPADTTAGAVWVSATEVHLTGSAF